MLPIVLFNNNRYLFASHYGDVIKRALFKSPASRMLLNLLFRRKSKKTSNLRVTSFCEGDPPVICGFPSQRANNAENISIWWRHQVWGYWTTPSLPQGTGLPVLVILFIFGYRPINSPPFGQIADTSQMNLSNAFSRKKSFVFGFQVHCTLFLRLQLTINPYLVQIAAWCQTGDKPLPEPMPTQFTDAYMRLWGEMS